MGEIQIASTPRLGQIVEPPLDALEVADAVAVRVLKGARVDLVDHARLPPGNFERGRQLRRPYCGACSPGDESHSFTREAVAAWRAFLFLSSRNEPGGGFVRFVLEAHGLQHQAIL